VEFLFWPLSVVYAFDWVSVGGQVQKHANDGGVAQVFDHGRALWIGSKTDRVAGVQLGLQSVMPVASMILLIHPFCEWVIVLSTVSFTNLISCHPLVSPA